MSAPELLPCPFCGNETVEDWGEPTWSRPAKWMYCTECQSCGPRHIMGRGEDYDAFMDRIKAEWNRRPTPPAIDPKVTAIVEALRDLCEVTDAAIDPRYSTAEEWQWRDEALAKARAALAAWEAQ